MSKAGYKMEPVYTKEFRFMISKEEISRIAHKLELSSHTIEKDYVLGWILAGIGTHPQINKSWVFKGGTALKKCYFENYRFSEDLDFTINDEKAATLHSIQQAINDISYWVYEQSGIEIDITRTLFETLENPAKQKIIQGRIFYKGPASPSSPRQWPRIKFDMTANEVVVNPPVLLNIINTPYSDFEEFSYSKINTYDLYDIFSEKIRALFERTRPRDLYDVVEIYKRKVGDIDPSILLDVLRKKCAYKNISKLDISELRLKECAAGWKDQLLHQLPNLLSFEDYLKGYYQIHKILNFDRLI